jgi:hypothetical protein
MGFFLFPMPAALPAEGARLMKKTVLFIVMVLIASFAFAGEKRSSVPLDDSPALGPSNAPVTIVEFLDFQ